MANTDSQELHQVDNDPGYLVVRNEAYSDQNATVSFGPDWQAPKYTNVVDVVNYYKPNPKNQLYLPENSFFNSNGKVRAHMGGETTFRGDTSNPNKNTSTHTNNYTFERQFGDVESVDSDKDTVVPEARPRGLFEVPFDVYSMPRLIAPFKGFSKIVTSRAVKLLTFNETEDEDLVCKVDKGALRTLQKQVGDLNVVSISFTGDPKSGKSFLASLLVGKENVSFNVSESYINPNNMLTHGTVWMYVAVYLEKHAYVFLDFEGFEHSEKSKTKMLLFAFAISSMVFCNVKYSLMNGIHNSVTAMIQLTKKPSVNAPLNDEEMLDEENEFLEILKDRGTTFMSKSYETENFNELNQDSESESVNEVKQRELWNAPIVQFVFRDCSGFVKCIDDRIYTPETLVEQGLFENYLDLFTPMERDPNFKNEMLDSFEVFTNRKYLSLPHPTLSTYPYSDNDYSDKDELNITEFFFKLLSSDKNDFKKLTRLSYDDFNLNSNLSSLFYEKLDHLKSIVYHDTLNYAMAHSQLNGRMFGEYLKKLAHEFNRNNNLSIDKLNETLSDVFLGENSNVLKESLLQFLRQIRAKVAPKLPLDSKTLLNLVYSAKFTSMNFFESKAFGTPEEYRYQLDELSDTLDELMRKLEDKNKTLMTAQIANYVERKEANIRANILRSGYGVNDLNDDLSKLKKSLNSKFSEADLVMKVLSRTSQNLVRIFNDTHPETFVHNLNYSKSTSIEETFQNLNSEITSMTSNLHLTSQRKGPPAYPGADDENDKLNNNLEDNTLDNEAEEETSESSAEPTEETYDNDDEEEEESYENEDEDQEYSSVDSEEVNEQNVENNNSTDHLNMLEVEQELNMDQDEDESRADNLNDKQQAVDNDHGHHDNKEVDKNKDKNNLKFQDTEQEPWIFGESGGTRSFRGDSNKFVTQNTNVVYDQGGTSETKEDEVVQVLEDDFAQEDFDDNDFNSNTNQVVNNNANENVKNTHQHENIVNTVQNYEEDRDNANENQNENEVDNEIEEEEEESYEEEDSSSTSSAEETQETTEETNEEASEDNTLDSEEEEETSESSAEPTEETYDDEEESYENEDDEYQEDQDSSADSEEVNEQNLDDNDEENKERSNNNTNEQNPNELDNPNVQNNKHTFFNRKKFRKSKGQKHSHRGAVLKELFDKAADSFRLHKSPKNAT